MVLGISISIMLNKGLKSLFLITLTATVSAANQAPTVRPVPVKLSGSIDGSELYREHCAVCHGIDGKGNGPAADALK